MNIIVTGNLGLIEIWSTWGLNWEKKNDLKNTIKVNMAWDIESISSEKATCKYKAFC